MNDEKEKKLFSLMAANRHEAFWQRQKKEILARTSAAPSHRKAWLLAPAAAAAALLFFVVRPQAPAPVPENQLVSTAFLEHLDLLDDMDVLEAVPENEL
jgi:hypothetical protein